uniref:Uncharacterized protein n=1 Tax=Oryza meridionalis TaxID=40149 RepID=A0A0E0DKN1_9ORYZ
MSVLMAFGSQATTTYLLGNSNRSWWRGQQQIGWLAGPFAVAVDLLAPLFTDLLRHRPSNAVVFDGVLPWAATAAAGLRIPRYAFTGMGCFALSVQ